MVTVPDKSVVGTVEEAVIGLVPLPLTYPVRVEAPVPPFEAFKTPASVTAPVVSDDGEKPVVPALKDVTPPAVEKAFQEPAEYPSYCRRSVL